MGKSYQIKEFEAGEYSIIKGQVDVIKVNALKEEIIIATLGEGEVFGELGVIQNRNRQTAVRARTDLIVKEFDTSLFDSLFDMEIGKDLLPIIQTMAERIRSDGNRLAELEYKIRLDMPNLGKRNNVSVILVPDSRKAQEAMNGLESIQIQKFPFKVGRNTEKRSDKLFHKNDLYLTDKKPYKISRNHFIISNKGDKYFFEDANSKLGSAVNNVRIGNSYELRKILLNEGENDIYLGSRSDRMYFKILIQ